MSGEKFPDEMSSNKIFAFRMLKNSIQIMKKAKTNIEAEGLMTFGELENGLQTMDFTCLTEVQMTESISRFKVRAMRDGNVYMTQIPKRLRNHAIFRDDNSSLSLGQNGRIYFVFTMPKEQVDELPAELVRQASSIAQKVTDDLKLKVKHITRD